MEQSLGKWSDFSIPVPRPEYMLIVNYPPTPHSSAIWNTSGLSLMSIAFYFDAQATLDETESLRDDDQSLSGIYLRNNQIKLKAYLDDVLL